MKFTSFCSSGSHYNFFYSYTHFNPMRAVLEGTSSDYEIVQEKFDNAISFEKAANLTDFLDILKDKGCQLPEGDYKEVVAYASRMSGHPDSYIVMYLNNDNQFSMYMWGYNWRIEINE